MKLTLNLGNMRSYAVAVVAGVLLLAGHSQKSEAAACGAGTWDQLLGIGFTCTIDDLTFSQFDFQSGDILASQINYFSKNGAPVVDGGDASGFWGFNLQFAGFGGAGSVGSPLVEDFKIAYTVACPTQTACLESVHGAIVGSANNGGYIVMDETFTAGSGSGTANPDSEPLANQFEEFFDPVQSISFTKDILGDCTPPAGEEVNILCNASISAINNWVDQGEPPISSGETSSGTTVPEPASLSLLAAGLMGLGLYRRRRNRG